MKDVQLVNDVTVLKHVIGCIKYLDVYGCVYHFRYEIFLWLKHAYFLSQTRNADQTLHGTCMTKQGHQDNRK